MLKALIFDFDGLILDTETPEYIALSEVYAEYGQKLSIETYGRVVGASYNHEFEPVRDLQTLSGRQVEAGSFWERVNRRRMDIITHSAALPGAQELIEQARARGLKLAVASSSPHAWVENHLQRLNLLDKFDNILCKEDVERIKPAPDLFLAALRAVGVRADEAVIFEDSLNGVIAAQKAGVRVIVVPNPITEHLHVNTEAPVYHSLAELSLEELIKKL